MPTLKVVSTSRRFQYMSKDMDVDAGEGVEGVDADYGLISPEERAASKGEALFRLTLDTASGKRTRGEEQGHSQLQIWRNWQGGGPHTKPSAAAAAARRGAGKPAPPPPTGLPLATAPAAPTDADAPVEFRGIPRAGGATSEQVALLLPTSLCSSEVSRTLVDELNESQGASRGIRFVALPHTEGCGVSDVETGADLLLGHLASPLVGWTVLLEHGCEKTHNDYFSGRMRSIGLDPSACGCASLQADGGLGAVREKVAGWFAQRVPASPPPRVPADLMRLGLGILADGGDVPEALALCLARIAVRFARDGLAVLPTRSALVSHPAFAEAALAAPARSSLGYGAVPKAGGFHLMATPSRRWVEMLSGLGGSGVHFILAWKPRGAAGAVGHPMVPVLTLALETDTVQVEGCSAAAADLLLPPSPSGGSAEWGEIILRKLAQLASGEYAALAQRQMNTDFQIGRGDACSL